MRLFSDKKLVITCLMGALPLLLIACFTEARLWALFAVVVLGVLAAFGFSSGDVRHPGLPDTERCVIGLLVKHGYSGAFRLHHVEHRIVPGGRAGRVNVQFKASLVMTEPLYQATVPPAGLCGGFTPRRIETLCKIADRMVRDLENSPGGFTLKQPANPYLRQFIASRSPQGWSLELNGAARATFIPRSGWQYSLTNSPPEFAVLTQTGQPRGAFYDAVVLDSSDGRQWLVDTVQAWATFEEDLGKLRATIDQQRGQSGRDAVALFFAGLRAGSCFEGLGETLTQSIPPRPFFLEITALDASQNLLHFTLRPDRGSPHTRRFLASVEYDQLAGVVRFSAQTTAADAVSEGGPLLNAATAFAMDFRWEPENGPQLVGEGADFVLTLHEPAQEAHAGQSAAVMNREREIWNAVAPGTSYAGDCTMINRDQRLLLLFVPGADLGGVAARIEGDGWSGIFKVGRNSRLDAGGPYDLLLEPLAVPVLVGAPDEAQNEAWQRLHLRVSGRELTGFVESGAGTMNVSLRC
jgi:hypothetical protein